MTAWADQTYGPKARFRTIWNSVILPNGLTNPEVKIRRQTMKLEDNKQYGCEVPRTCTTHTSQVAEYNNKISILQQCWEIT
jgi:hypothetical protein